MVSPVTLLAPAPSGPAQRPAARGSQGDLFAATLAAQDATSRGPADRQAPGAAGDAAPSSPEGQLAGSATGSDASGEAGAQWMIADGAQGSTPASLADVAEGDATTLPVEADPGDTAPEPILADDADTTADAAPESADETNEHADTETDAPMPAESTAPLPAENLAGVEDAEAQSGPATGGATAAAAAAAAAQQAGDQVAGSRGPTASATVQGGAAPASSPTDAGLPTGTTAPAPQPPQTGPNLTAAGQSTETPIPGATSAEAVVPEGEEAVVPARSPQGPAPVERPLADGAVRPVELPATPRAEAAARTEAPAPAAPPAPPPPVANQLAGALARLKTAPDGHHVLNIRVDPEDLGPVRVSAHIGPEGVRIELFGVTDSARDALRGALSELRRDLAATGLQAELELGSREGSADQSSSGPGDQTPGTPGSGPNRPAPTTTHPTVPLGSTGLDLLA